MTFSSGVRVNSIEECQNNLKYCNATELSILKLSCKNIVFSAEVEYSYFSADFRLKTLL